MITPATLSPTPTAPCARSAHDWHPLELIGFFQRWQPSWRRNILYTLIWNTLLWLGFCVVALAFANSNNWPRLLFQTLVITHSIGFSIHLLFVIGGVLVGPRIDQVSAAWRTAYFSAIPTLGVFVGYTIGFAALDLPNALNWLYSLPGARGVAILSVVLSIVLTAISSARIRQRDTEARLAQETQRATEAERRSLEAQLRLLQAQIEPHFLYNTLGNAVSLIGPAPDKARLLLERLITYLRATLTNSRDSATTLEGEFASLKAYLELMQIRMGERLRFTLDLPADLHQFSVPPMLLQPLVENAVQHGLEPKIDGGRISVEAARDGNDLLLQVSDTGVGFDPAARPRPGGGIGLTNLRQRLATQFEHRASLTLADNVPSGLRITLRLPLETT